MFYHVYVLRFFMFTHILQCLGLDLCFHMLVWSDLCFYVLYTSFHLLVWCFSCHVLMYPFHDFTFLSCVFGLLVRTWSRPYGLCHHPYTLAQIKGFGLPILHVYACLILCLISMLASLDLGFTTFDALSGFVVMWLHPTPIRPCLDVTIWEASPWCQLLRAYLSPFPLHAMLCLPCLFAPPVGLYAFLDACLHVQAWVLLANVSSILQHNESLSSSPFKVIVTVHVTKGKRCLIFAAKVRWFVARFFTVEIWHFAQTP